MRPEPTSESGEYWKEHMLSWEAAAYYKDSSARPACFVRVDRIDVPRGTSFVCGWLDIGGLRAGG